VGRVRVKKSQVKRKIRVGRRGVFIVSKKGGKPKIGVGKELPTILFIEGNLLKLVIMLRMRLLCL
jgi:hypothetical protein